MTLLEIPRTKAGCVVMPKPLGNSEREVLAGEALAKLGYAALRDEATGAKTLGSQTGALTEALLKLDIEPLDTASVLKYQMEEAGRKTLEKIHERFSDWVSGWFSAATWQHTEIGQYKQAVPEFVLRKAIQIKEALPMVQFFIQHLSEPKADPFLIARLGDEIYYIEAWDEPRFEQAL